MRNLFGKVMAVVVLAVGAAIVYGTLAADGDGAILANLVNRATRPPTVADCQGSFGDFCLVSSSLTLEGGHNAVTGSVVNRSATRAYRNVRATISLRDANGIVIGTATATADAIRPRATWNFRAPLAVDGVQTWRVDSIAGD